MITEENVKELFNYCPETGDLTWKIGGGNKYPGKLVGSIRRTCGLEYKQMHHEYKWYFVHRVIWFYVYGYWPDRIDHINRNGMDNRIENLREVSNAENQRNRGLFKKNKIGINGVYYQEKYNSYKVYIGDKDYLGSAKDLFEACCMRKSAERKRGFHENHGHSSAK